MTLPNLLIVGVPKAGTSSLFDYLAQHPDICASSKKETGYFTGRREDGRRGPVEDYERYFVHRTRERYAMEATPASCYGGPQVIEAIRVTLDQPRIVLILRDPVERLWSAYTFQRSLGHLGEIGSFDEYVVAAERARSQLPSIYEQGSLKGLSIGVYADFVPAWLDAFGTDASVLFFDELRQAPVEVVRSVAGWLSIDTEVVSGFRFEVRNPTIHPRSLALARAAAIARGASKRVLPSAPALRRRFRDAYFRINRGRIDERPSEETLAHLRSFYAPSNAIVASALEAHGARTLPPWLREASES
jgi:hypothetical protein